MAENSQNLILDCTIAPLSLYCVALFYVKMGPEGPEKRGTIAFGEYLIFFNNYNPTSENQGVREGGDEREKNVLYKDYFQTQK